MRTMSPVSPSPPSPARLIAVALAGWALFALASAAQGVVFAAYRGVPQPWWPTLGYSVAIFSVWALLTPPLLALADRVARQRQRVVLHALGLPLATLAHVLLFVALYRPVYGAGLGVIEMARAVLMANLDTAVFAYAALIGASYARRRFTKRDAPPVAEGLWIRERGTARLVRFADIDWIGAAGDYAEVHTGPRALLTDQSLTTLDAELPAREFARIHRGAIVRLDRVAAVKGVGRGDAEVRLRCGAALRLSRRYRDRLAAHLPL
ncbi:LytR/AlgR family response regulator transcription factor [Sphingoaurantiacus capsulatus]|uniref:LytR/AlgR family response regulator transcription factor n=1 Tax=Sphingoaurantiacus capsulatus TaxID=1771310 RepID=A0ABV7X718_9SPHN